MQRHPMRRLPPPESANPDPLTHNVFGKPIRPRPYQPPAAIEQAPTPPRQSEAPFWPGVGIAYAVTTTEEIVVRRTTTVSYVSPLLYPAVVPVQPLTTSTSTEGAYPSNERPLGRSVAELPVVHTEPPAASPRADWDALWAVLVTAALLGLGAVMIVLALALG